MATNYSDLKKEMTANTEYLEAKMKSSEESQEWGRDIQTNEVKEENAKLLGKISVMMDRKLNRQKIDLEEMVERKAMQISQEMEHSFREELSHLEERMETNRRTSYFSSEVRASVKAGERRKWRGRPISRALYSSDGRNEVFYSSSSFDSSTGVTALVDTGMPGFKREMKK